ncbi:hypothetical protein STRTUCAR8_02889 [Streptomyces turgidiscabies Car8]|uniref:Uncharacterized protein n=1 Tax=Streptomyces turgidiscabies (strain Car8) TaxID=698760 RepID=L7F757_STRT8|nr:hypothetical protein STRTUCAR8_02889 [Streptomyces turgidiscabies Car8]
MGDAGVQGTDDADDVVVADEGRGVGLAGGGLGHLVEGLDLEREPPLFAARRRDQ